MDPFQHIASVEGLRTHAGEEGLPSFVSPSRLVLGASAMRYRSAGALANAFGKKNAISAPAVSRAVGTMHRVFVHGLRMIGANGAGRRILRVGRPISSRFLAIAFSPSSTWTMTGPEV